MTDGLGLGDAYGATIERIKAQDGDKSRLGIEALMWVSHAEQPLKAGELCHALAIELGSRDFNVENAPSISKVVSCCQGLIAVDKEASTVRLIHFTLQEYLSAHRDIFSRPHSAMAEVCLTYMNSERVKALSDGLFLNLLDMPFLEYCSLYWGVHAKRELSDDAKLLALELLREYNDHISAVFIFQQLGYGWYFDDLRFSGLHCASFFGIAEVAAALIELGCITGINEEDTAGFTPLGWAAHNGDDKTVNILLGCEEVNPDKPDEYGLRTPLSRAAQNGHEEVVKILVGREEVGSDKPDRYCQTPLSYAAENGHQGVAKILLAQEEVNPDRPDFEGRTPLLYAVSGGHEAVVKMLLGRGEVDPDRPGNWGHTPLSCAAGRGHEGVVKTLLVQKEVNPEKPDRKGRTPLWHAIQNRQEGTVKALLAREEVNPNKADNSGETPLMLATGHGDQKMMALLQPYQVVTNHTI